MKLLIIGGSDAGISAALRAKELAPETEITVVVRDQYPNFSICGIPFYLSGEIKDWHNLAHRTETEIHTTGIHLLLNHKAEEIDSNNKTVMVRTPDAQLLSIPYDKLIIGTGAESVIPPIDGIISPGVYTLRWMEDCFKVSEYLQKHNPRHAAIIGAGYIGMEMADALTKRGIHVTILEYFDSVLTTLDQGLGKIIQNELDQKGVTVRTGTAVKSIYRNGNTLEIYNVDTKVCEADLVIVAVGARPETSLSQTASIKLGTKGAINVNRKMETSIADIYAAGDCAETWHHLLNKKIYLPLGTTSHKQGRIAGENAVGGEREFKGSLGTQAVKIFDFVAARTGLNDKEALDTGYEPLTILFETWDHKVYYPGAHTLHIRITGDLKTGQLLGAQIIGHREAEVSKRIDIIAGALYSNMKIESINDLDLSYTPPLSSYWDPVQMAAQDWEHKQRML